MAEKSGERRMLFDTGGRRKHVLRVVYAILALLMGGSLFLTVGPFNIGEFLGNSGTSSAAEVFEEQAERIEGRLAKNPKDEGQLVALTRARIAAGNARSEEDPATGGRLFPAEAKAEFEAAQAAWERYLEVADDPNPAAAQLVATTNFSLAESGGSLEEIDESISRAVAAQRLAAAGRPSVGSLSTLAIYEYFEGNFAAGDRAAEEAAKLAPSKSEGKGIEKQLVTYRKRGKAWNKQRQKFAKEEQARGKEQLQNPLGGLSGSGP